MYSEIFKKYPELTLIKDQAWRLNNLYHIKDAQGRKIRFKPNWAQQEILAGLHTCNIILKARQLGITTLFCIYLLDQVLWTENLQCGIIAHTLNDTQSIFVDKLKFAFDNLHPALRALFRTTGDSNKELSFTHGSVIRVGTSLRSSTNNFLHISELGKICSKYPEKAREIATGALQTVHIGQHVFIESTAEGKEGLFSEMWDRAWNQKLSGKPYGPLDYKPFFFPWWRETAYSLMQETAPDDGLSEKIPTDLDDYFAKLSLKGIELTPAQKTWYTKKYELLHEDMLREFPSYPEEAFQASQEANWYAKQMKDLWNEGHITNVSYDRALPVFTAWDLGQADYTAIWFFQITRSGELSIIDYFQGRDMPLDSLTTLLHSKKYNYGKCIWPSDANARDRAGITFVSQARKLGWQGVVLEQHSLRDGINLVRSTLGKCWFDKTKCRDGIACLENYTKKWSPMLGGWSSDPLHNEYSHGADAFRYLCAGYQKVGTSKSIEGDYQALRNYFGG